MYSNLLCFVTARDSTKIEYIEAYLKANKMYRNHDDSTEDPVYSEVIGYRHGDHSDLHCFVYMQSIELDLSTVVPSLSGPKRPHDRVALNEMKEDFQKCLDNKVSSCNSSFTFHTQLSLAILDTAMCIVEAVKFCRLASKDST